MKKGTGFFSSMFGGASSAYEDSAERYNRAGNAYKGSKNCACLCREHLPRLPFFVALAAV